MGSFHSVESNGKKATVYVAPFSWVGIKGNGSGVSITRFESKNVFKRFNLPSLDDYVLVYGRDWLILIVIVFFIGVLVGYCME